MMGHYHEIYNVDKKEFFGEGKLLENIGYVKSNSTALFLLLANSNGRGGGDAEDHAWIGRWAGDRIVIQGDYANENDQAFIADTDQYKDITLDVLDMLDVALKKY